MKTIETRTGSMEVRYSLRRETFTSSIHREGRREDEELLENLNEVYGEPMEQEERDFVRAGKDYHRRRLSAG